MQEKHLEVLGLEARNEKLRFNIHMLETENARLKNEASLLKEEIGGLTKKIEVIKNEDYKLYTNLLSLEEKHANLLHEKKDRDDKVWELEKQVEFQKSELAKANEKIETQKKNEQGRNTLAEHLIKSCIEIKRLESNIANLEAQAADFKKWLDHMKNNCQTQHRENRIPSPISSKKTQIKDEGQRNINSTNENFSEEKSGEPLVKLETNQAKLLHDFEEMKNKIKDRDYKVLELEKKFGSQNLELARVYNEIRQNENERCMNALAERLLKPCFEAKKLENNVANVEVQNAEYKNRLDEMEKICEILHLRNKILSMNGGKNYL